MKVRVLVLGAGDVWKRKIKPALGRLQAELAKRNCELAAWVVDVSPPTTDLLLVEDAFCVDEPAEMERLLNALSNGKIQVAVVASPNETHISYLSWLLGKVDHVIVEKPLTHEVIEAQLAVSLAQSTTTKCYGLEHYIAKPQARVILRMAQSGELARMIGNIEHIQFVMRQQDPINLLRARTLRRGLALDMAIHGFAFILRLLNLTSAKDIRIVGTSAAKYQGAPIDGETAARIDAAVQNGPMCTIDIGKGIADCDDKRIVLHGSLGTLIADFDGKTVTCTQGGQPVSLPDSLVSEAARADDDAYDFALREPILDSCDLSVSLQEPRWLVDLSLAANALFLVEKARVCFDEEEEYLCGTMPRIFHRSARLGGASVEAWQSQTELEFSALNMLMSEAKQAIDRHGNFVLVIPGGTSFLGVTRLLASNKFKDVSLSQWDIFFSDEHWIHHSDSGNNYMLAQLQGGWADLVMQGRLKSEQVHRIVVEDANTGELLDQKALEASTRQYEDVYRSRLGSRTGADLAFLGLGADCHTASLLPNKKGRFMNPLLDSSSAFSVVQYLPRGDDQLRCSITLAGIADCRKVVLIAFGSAKRSSVTKLLTNPIDLERMPSSVIRLVGGTVLTDVACVSRLPGLLV